MSHLTKGLDVLKTLPDTLERAQQELVLLTTLGPALIATRSYAAPEVSQVYTRARELCQQVGETPQLFSVLWGLARFYLVRAEPQTARELGEQLFSLAQRLQDPALVLEAHRALGQTLFYLGDFAGARAYLEQGIALYDPERHRDLAFRYGRDPGVDCRGYLAWTLWVLGYPDQAIECIHQALLMAHALAHPFTLAATLIIAAMVEQFCGHVDTVQERAAAAVDLSIEHGFPYWLAAGEILQGWVLAEQGHAQAGLVQMHRGLVAWRATGAEFVRPYFVALLAEAHPQAGQVVAGLSLLAEALAVVDQHGEQWWEVELYRLMGTLALLQTSEQCGQHRVSPEDAAEAETRLRHALDVARQQQAKSLELRAAMGLARLWQQQGKRKAARELLTPIYNWFCEGFETTDLKEAKALLEALSS
jgi:predicted ATPase